MNPQVGLLLLCCQLSFTAHSQWQNGTNIYNTNSGNVGIGTQTPNFHLDVNGSVAVGGTTYNLGQTANSSGLSNIQGTGKMVVGWNLTNSRGETDFIANTLSGLEGGFGFWDYNSSGSYTNLLRLTAGGYLGVGMQFPNFQLDVNGAASLGGMSCNLGPSSTYSGKLTSLLNTGKLLIGWNRTDGNGETDLIASTASGQAGGIAFWNYSASGVCSNLMYITSTGNVLIGKTSQTNSGYMLDVNGNVRANQVVVNTTGADFVFDSSYRLSRLAEVETFIRREHHLPGIAPAAEMQKDGVDLGANQTRLLAKIEELTLYLIEKDKEVTDLKRRISELEQRNRTQESLEQRIERLEKAEHSGGGK
jgi:hypothetical protein